MLAIHPEYVVDNNSIKKAVILPVIEWEKILKVLEEFEDIKEYDAVKKQNEEIIPFESALEEIENGKFDDLQN